MKRRGLQLIAWFLIAVMIPTMVSGCTLNSKNNQQQESSQTEVYPQRPALWKATTPNSKKTIYLLGSIHAAEESLYPMDEDIMNAFNECDALAVEVDIYPYITNPVKAMELTPYTMYTDGRSVTDEIDPELFQRIQNVLTEEEVELGVPIDKTAMFRPYTFVSLLTNISLERAGLSAELGVDRHFLQLARDREMEIMEIESMQFQLGMLQDLSPSIQTYLLEDGLLLDKNAEGVKKLYDGWKVGDLEILLEESEEENESIFVAPADLEEYHKALLSDRNTGMTDVAEQYLKKGKKVFYVVGALHMVGEDGIVQQLIDRGYRVTRI